MSEYGRLDRHYRIFPEAGRLHKSRVRRLEYDTTVRVLEKHIEPGSSIIELGAGHGSYSLHFARAGHHVLATDLLARHIEAMREQIEREGLRNARTSMMDAARLNQVPDGHFDVVLCLGPFYHRPDLRELPSASAVFVCPWGFISREQLPLPARNAGSHSRRRLRMTRRPKHSEHP